MFGVIRGEKFQTGCGDQRALMQHVCGLCLTLRRHTGQVARLTTNFDAALLSVLYAALRPDQVRTFTHYCPLRAGVRGQVIAENPGTKFAASISLLSASVKIDDHLQDRDTWLTRLAWPFRWLSQRWRCGARRLAHGLGFATTAVENQAAKQAEVEAKTQTDFDTYARPTEEAVGEACRHVARLAETPERMPVLHRLGQLFGRIMYLVDAYKDYDADRRRGQFNPLAKCFGEAERHPQSFALFRVAHRELCQRLEELRLPEPHLAKRLLVVQLGHVGRQTFQAMSASGEQPDSLGPREDQEEEVRRRQAGAQAAASQSPCTGCGYTGCDACCDATFCGMQSADCCSSSHCSGDWCGDCGGLSCDCNC